MEKLNESKPPYETLENLFKLPNPVCYDFKLENVACLVKEKDYINRFLTRKGHCDCCKLARDFYNKIFTIDSTLEKYGGKHIWSYDTINSFKTIYNQSDVLQKKEDKNKKREDLKYLQHFAFWTHTLGNFTPIPFYTVTEKGYIRSTNQQRGSRKEYIDRTFIDIKKAFELMSFVDQKFNGNKKELDFKTDYIDYFCLQEYCTINNDEIIAIPLFDRKFENKTHPQSLSELKECILEIIIRIIKRGIMIVEKYYENNKTEESYKRKSRIKKECENLLTFYINCKNNGACDICKNYNDCLLDKSEKIIKKQEDAIENTNLIKI